MPRCPFIAALLSSAPRLAFGKGRSVQACGPSTEKPEAGLTLSPVFLSLFASFSLYFFKKKEKKKSAPHLPPKQKAAPVERLFG